MMASLGGACGKELACQCWRQKRQRLDPSVEKIPWRRAWQPLQYSCLENPHGGRILGGYIQAIGPQRERSEAT